MLPLALDCRYILRYFYAKECNTNVSQHWLCFIYLGYLTVCLVFCMMYLLFWILVFYINFPALRHSSSMIHADESISQWKICLQDSSLLAPQRFTIVFLFKKNKREQVMDIWRKVFEMDWLCMERDMGSGGGIPEPAMSIGTKNLKAIFCWLKVFIGPKLDY